MLCVLLPRLSLLVSLRSGDVYVARGLHTPVFGNHLEFPEWKVFGLGMKNLVLTVIDVFITSPNALCHLVLIPKDRNTFSPGGLPGFSFVA